MRIGTRDMNRSQTAKEIKDIGLEYKNPSDNTSFFYSILRKEIRFCYEKSGDE
jgi:hypothetical protein